MTDNDPQPSAFIKAATDKTPGNPEERIAVYCGGLLLLATLTVCYFAAEIILPLALAFTLNLALRPLLRKIEALHIPRFLGALVIILAIMGTGALIGAALSEPAAAWGQKLPAELPKLKEKLNFLIQPAAMMQKTVAQAQQTADGGDGKVTVSSEGSLSDRLFSSTRLLITGIFETLLILFFFLLAGATFQQRFIEILPRTGDKQKALEISQQIQSDIAAYLRTITMMNLLVGAATFFIMLFCGMPNPILWAALAFLLNYVPILGPMAGICVFILVGMTADDANGFMMFLPALLYLGVHIAEGEIITPLLLSGRFTLNPALVIIMLLFWYWAWGVTGAFLATPMLAMLKILCDRIARLQPLGHLIEG